ncbi:MAG: gamma-glutamylcyclotransferase family protein [Candidatus Bathyarchaeota archaeon]|nr:gamma-glutamylcyclotransferase family protein [Candidatus Bathyarchaeota archaeon]
MLYFSYGSFLDSETLRRHCPEVVYGGKAILPNWEVQFNFLSRTYRGGVTGIEPAAAKLVRGVLYEVNDEELLHLDSIEGVPEGIYYRQTIFVVDESGNAVKAATYRTTNPRGPFKPTKKYVGLMIRGAKEHHLDPEYVKELEAIETID